MIKSDVVDRRARFEALRLKQKAETRQAKFQHLWTPISFPSGPLYVDHPEHLPRSGIYYNPHFLTREEQERVMSIVDGPMGKWSNVIARRQQFWGDVYYHTTHDEARLQPLKQGDSPLDQCDIEEFRWLLDKFDEDNYLRDVPATASGQFIYKNREWKYKPTPAGVFTASLHGKVERADQILVNEYCGRMGIFGHLDDPDAFGQVLVMVSLGDPVIMRLSHHLDHENRLAKILLEPGSVLILKGEARHEYWHGISKHKLVAFRAIDGREVYFERTDEFRRVSLTIRHLLDGRKKIPIDTERVDQ